jgi:hypothetical protein
MGSDSLKMDRTRVSESHEYFASSKRASFILILQRIYLY